MRSRPPKWDCFRKNRIDASGRTIYDGIVITPSKVCRDIIEAYPNRDIIDPFGGKQRAMVFEVCKDRSNPGFQDASLMNLTVRKSPLPIPGSEHNLREM